MTSLRQLLRSSTWFLLLMLLGMSLFWESCENLKKRVQVPEEVALFNTSDTLENTLDSEESQTHINYFRSADTGTLSQDFFFGGKKTEDLKAICFRLNPKQTELFFTDLNQKMASKGENDSVRIRIHMAQYSVDPKSRVDKPNLTLLVEVVKSNTVSSKDKFYPLRSLQKRSDIPISSRKADDLNYNWDTISSKNTPKQLYVNEDVSDPKKRIEYYTFIASDTKDIYDYRQKNPNCTFYIYLGQLKEPNHVPLRMIIRLTKNFKTSPTRLTDDEGDDDNFEFSSQCPPICQ